LAEEKKSVSSNSDSLKRSNPPTIIFAGFARLPANASMPSNSSTLAIELEVDPFDMRIVDVACSSLPTLGEKFLTSLLVGKRIDGNKEEVFNEIRSRYMSTTQRAMIAAIEDAFKRFEEFQKIKE
jgi:hypothetical protein